MKRVCIFLIISCCCFSGCSTQDAARQRQLLTMREMSDLVTVEYTVTKIIKASDDKTWYKAGDRKILMSCRAYIRAGIDLSAISDKDIVTTANSIAVQLPPAKIISLSIPPENIVVEYQEIDLFRSAFKAGERDALAAQAEAQIRSSAESMGILQTAEENAAAFLTAFLKRAGYTGITIGTTAKPITKPKKD